MGVLDDENILIEDCIKSSKVQSFIKCMDKLLANHKRGELYDLFDNYFKCDDGYYWSYDPFLQRMILDQDKLGWVCVIYEDCALNSYCISVREELGLDNEKLMNDIFKRLGIEKDQPVVEYIQQGISIKTYIKTYKIL